MTTAVNIAPARAKQRSRQVATRRVMLIILQIVLTLVLLSFLAPTLWMVSSALKSRNEIFAQPIVWIPSDPQWQNFVEAWTILPFGRFAVNTFVICILTVTGTLVSSSLVAYSFSRLKWPGRDLFFGMLLATMMLPEIITLIPMFIEFRTLGWTRPGTIFGVLPLNFLPLTVPYWLALAPLYVFLLRQFFKSIPIELEEAAFIDGANRLQILTKIILPLSKPVIATVAVFVFLQSYNDFLQPLIYLNGQDNWTLALGLRSLSDAQQTGRWDLLFAAATLILLPVLAIFILAQRYFVEGIATTGFGGR